MGCPMKFTMKPGETLMADEKELYDVIQSGDTARALDIIKNGCIRVDCLDENGATPLQQAAFKGNVELCRVLLDRGADVNSNEHEHAYTALMFGALSGQHHCVSVINNYLSIEDVERIIHPKGIDTKERIPMKFAKEIHQLVRSYNIHPVKIIKFLQANIELVEHRKPFVIVLEELFDLQMKQKETNEVMALKLWIIVFTIKEAFKFIDLKKSEGTKTPDDLLVLFAKQLLATDAEANFPKNLELLARQGIKAFPYHQSVLFQTLVKSVGQTEFGNEPSALSYLHQALLGQRMMMDETFCAACGEPAKKKRCAGCKAVNYCSAECQKLHWFSHKRWCATLAMKQDMMNEQWDVDESAKTEGADGSDAAETTQGPSVSSPATPVAAENEA
uniref:MYND-type domain-containing protein n=1 Tax=Plectus sambesii TaxID=2011161 RepID=A0A914XJU7_9BILA